MPRHESEQREKGIWRFLGLKRVLFANAVIFAIVIWGLAGEFLRNRDMQREFDHLDTQAKAIEKQNAEVEDMGKRLSSGAMLEREARTKLNLQKPGEQVVVVRTSGTANQADEIGHGTEKNAVDTASVSNIVRWWHYFFP